MRSNKPHVLVTMGDPSGVGPEVTLKALASPGIAGLANFLLIGDGAVFAKTSRLTGVECAVPVLDLKNVSAGAFSYGVSRPEYGKASMQFLDVALDRLKQKKADCLVTGPINKSSIRQAGFARFQGHTEYLAAKTSTKSCAMMFVGDKLKITLVTRHVALHDIGKLLSPASIFDTIAITHKHLKKYFGLRDPKVGVAGLNPHAGEGGLFGTEEKDCIIPAIKKAIRRGMRVTGPLPPDVIFHDALKGRFDAVIALYHDQGLIPFKLLYFEDGVNLTLGLPFVRTSPDHGTAFDIAGKGIADPRSMIAAIKLACRLRGRS